MSEVLERADRGKPTLLILLHSLGKTGKDEGGHRLTRVWSPFS